MSNYFNYIFRTLLFLYIIYLYIILLPTSVSYPLKMQNRRKCEKYEFRTIIYMSGDCHRHCYAPRRTATVCRKLVGPGCRCRTDWVYVSSDYMVCIPQKYCPKIGDEHVEFSECEADCQPRCDCLRDTDNSGRCYCNNYNRCVPGFVCQNGYLRDREGWCVPPDQCLERRRLAEAILRFPSTSSTSMRPCDKK